MLVKLRAITERLRGSLFLIPALSIIAALGVSWITVRIDTNHQGGLADVPFILETTVPSARALLSTIAGATITVAGLVFSVTVVAIQLTSSQFSPRALRGYLRDRFQQTVLGIVIGTFTYSLVVLAVTRSVSPETSAKNLSVTIALALGILAALAIVAFIDRGTRALQVSAIIRRIADETLELTHELHSGNGTHAAQVVDRPLPEAAAVTVASTGRGWVQQIDEREILRAIPAGSSAKLEVRIGEFVAPGDPLLTIWSGEISDSMQRQVNGAFATGRIRTMQQDIPFGIGQLVDIALRALSPGINDPTTAIEAIVEIGTVLGEILTSDLPPRVVPGPDDRVLYRPRDLDRAGYIRTGFTQIRIAGSGHPEIVETVIWELGRLLRRVMAADPAASTSAIRTEARLAVDGLRSGSLLDEDVAPIVDLAVDLGLIERPADGPNPAPPGGGSRDHTTGGAEAGPTPAAATRALTGRGEPADDDPA